MMIEAIITGLFLVVLLIVLMIFRKPIKRYAEHCDNVISEWSAEREEERREETLERMREFLNKEEYFSPSLLFERMRSKDEDSRYYNVAKNEEKLKAVYEKEDMLLAKELQKRQAKIRDLLTCIEITGEWPMTCNEINEMMRIEWKKGKIQIIK